MIRLNNFVRLARSATRKGLCVVLMLSCSAVRPLTTFASEPVMTGRTTVRISDVGVGNVKISLRTQQNYYTALKQMGSNFNLLARKIGMDDRNWYDRTQLNGKFIDTNNEVELAYETPGAARNVKGDHWTVSMA